MTQEGVLNGVLEAGRQGFKIHGNPADVFGALAKAQASFGPIQRTRTVHVRSDKGNYTFAYAPLDEILSKVIPALTANGLAFSQPLVQEGDKWVLRTILAHESGSYVECSCSIPWPVRWKDGKSYPGGWQEFGSAVTYARRYTGGPLLGIAPEEDDDGTAAEDMPRETQARAPGPRQNSRPTPPPAPQKAAQKPEPAKQPTGGGETFRAISAAIDDGVKAAERSRQDSGGPALSAPVESAPPQPPEAPPPSAVVPEAKKSTPPPLPTLISSEQQKEIGEMLRGARLYRQIDPQTGEAFDAKFTRAQADAFFVQVVGKKTTEISSYDDAARVIAALRQLPAPPPVST